MSRRSECEQARRDCDRSADCEQARHDCEQAHHDCEQARHDCERSADCERSTQAGVPVAARRPAWMRFLAVDVVALAAYLLAANPDITGLPVHEWVSLGVAVVLFVHTVQHYDWAIDTFRRLTSRISWATTGNLVLDIVTLVVFVVVMVSGIGVSRWVLPTFGLFAAGYFVWNPMHALSAKLLLALVLVHVVVHWKWFASLARRRKPARKTSAAPVVQPVEPQRDDGHEAQPVEPQRDDGHEAQPVEQQAEDEQAEPRLDR